MFRKIFFTFAYLRRPIWDSGVSPQELLDFLATHPSGKALDMGCGTGTNLITLAQHGWQATGVDFSPLAIRAARRKAHAHHVDLALHLADVTRLDDIHGPFDLILDMGCYHSLAPGKRPLYIANVDRLLADDGTFLLYTFIGSGIGTSGPGSSEEELRYVDQRMHIVERKDGDERGFRPSAWLTIQRRPGSQPG
jgi:SAM-dependent methyltransferase